jgi:predicted nuclease of predicted toxin-antitoxin system
LRLLLDEHYSPAIAEQLRKRGYDVVAAADSAELKHKEDPELLRWAARQRRAVVSENARDFAELHKLSLTHREAHYGIVLTNARRFPRNRAGIGRLVRALDNLLLKSPAEDALGADLRWLEEKGV